MWARIGIRAFYGQALSGMAAENPNVMAVSADLGRSSGLDRFSKISTSFRLGLPSRIWLGCLLIWRMGFDVFASTLRLLHHARRAGAHEHGLHA